MPYDQELADRIRSVLKGTPGLSEKRMFGGLAFLVHGHVAASAYHDGRLLITCSREDFDDLLSEAGAGPMMHGGKPASGWILVEADAVTKDAILKLWVDRGLTHSRSKVHRK